jgi:UDP-N-acetylglucosamine acyltransferase
MTNGAALAGHVEVGRGTILSAHTGVHQFCWVGELVMSRGQAGASQHVPPFVVIKDINHVAGLNRVGLQRAEDITDEDRRQIKQAYRILYRSGLGLERALAEMDACDDWGAPAGRFRDFVRRVLSAKAPHDRGLATARAARRS